MQNIHNVWLNNIKMVKEIQLYIYYNFHQYNILSINVVHTYKLHTQTYPIYYNTRPDSTRVNDYHPSA